MVLNHRNGFIEVIVGPMFAGKTEELIRRVKRMQYAKKNIVVFKPSIDNRYGDDDVVSHDDNRTKSINIQSAQAIIDHVLHDTDVIAVDEVQFLGVETIKILNAYADKGKRVIVSGLDLDFRGEPFGIVPVLAATAEYVTKLSAVCVKCGAPATRTQRMVNGKPAKYHDPVILIGAKESYEARCRHCHKVYRKPKDPVVNTL